MFTGIVKVMGEIADISGSEAAKRFLIKFPEGFLHEVETGASIAINGTCLTLVEFDGNRGSFDVMGETLVKTNLGTSKIGDKVNVERSFKVGDEIGGHPMSGHIAGMAEVILIDADGENTTMRFLYPQNFSKYLFEKGFIGLNGASLTVTNLDKNASVFTIWFIPETLERTTFGALQIGDKVNMEIDSQTQVIVDTVERVMKEAGNS
ncbi:MAG: riboflavin synthase subunit alpha [bacterium]|nr:riboflavin synthase subunit alpha [bacterium]MDA1024639.1 riboflavin synthase subunit alpha [bacterium]